MSDQEQVLIIQTPDGYLVSAGHPSCVKAKELKKYVDKGFLIKTITIDDYRSTEWKWIYDKNITPTQ